MIASFLYQALQHEGKEVFAFDTDPVNATLGAYKEFHVTKIDVLRQLKRRSPWATLRA